MPDRKPRRPPSSGPLDPAEDLLLEPEQLELLASEPARSRPRDTPPGHQADERSDGGDGWRPPLAVAYADAAALGDAALDEQDQDEADPDLPYWLAFNRVKGIGPARFALLLSSFVRARNAWEADPKAWRAAGLDERTAASLARQRTRIDPDAEVERLEKLHVRALTTSSCRATRPTGRS